MKNFYHLQSRVAGLSCLVFTLSVLFIEIQAQSFSQNNLNFNGHTPVNNGTSLTYGPDGRLYVAEYTGQIKIYTIERGGPGQYIVQDIEVLNGILQIQDHNDDGSLHSSTFRETIGLVVTGTATNPVVYVSSSDFRIGGGGGGGSGDVGLDTNSGIITRFTWTGTVWEVVDIVRGLPRSEENHATNGMEFTTVNGVDYLIVAQGGHTNAGGPSTNFAYTTEYALSAAILSVNLTQLKSMPILEDNGRKYIYDLPTLDDPTRPNVNGITDPDAPGYDGIDINDPFGGNDGLNQAIIVPGGPVQIFSPGYRNAFDLVVTESGAVYVTDNGANGGWGGFPVNEGGGNANNDYDPNEPGSTSLSGYEIVNNKDHLTLITSNINNYEFGSFYGGHPTPIRANPEGAGLYTNPSVTGTEGAVFRTLIYHPTKNETGYTTDPAIGLPANWPPVQVANPVEGDYRGPGDPNPDGPEDELVTIWGTNTNGIDEYKASNFDGAMKGDLIAGVNTGELRRVELNADGSLKQLTPSFASGIGGDALGIACNGDNDIFPGTIWVVTLNGNLVVFEPQDFDVCLLPGDEGYDPLADYDFDGYTNQDEIDNGTNPCNGASQPSDHDKAVGAPLISDLNDLDDDSDGIPDAEDPFQLGDPLKVGSDAFVLPVINELFSSNKVLQGYMGLGMTGLMNNRDPNPNWLNWLDRRDDPSDPNPNDILGGAIGAMTMHMTAGTALGTSNNQEKGFQYGVQVDESTGIFTVAGSLFNFNAPLQLYGHPNAPNGELGIFIGTGFQDNYIKFVLTKNGLTIQQEINDVPLEPLNVTIPVQDRPESGAALFFVIDPVTGNIDFEYTLDNGPRITAGSILAQGAILEAIQIPGKDLAVGLIGTSNVPGTEVEGTWDYLNATTGNPVIAQQIENIEREAGSASEVLNLNNYFFDDKGVENLIYTIIENTNSAFNPLIENNLLTIHFPSFPGQSVITIRATDADNNYVEQAFTVSIIEMQLVIYRVNAGGPLITSIDGEINWGADSPQENSPYLAVPGTNTGAGFSMTGYDQGVDQSTTPVTIFESERYDANAGPPNMTYSFPVDKVGRYEVRLYFGNGFDGTAAAGSRIFNVEVEGVVPPPLNNIDLSALFGHQTGGIISHYVDVSDGMLDISFIHVEENPLINGIEIIRAGEAGTPIQVTQIPNQINIEGDELNGSLAVQASGGDGNLVYSMTGAPEGIVIEPTNGQIGGTIAAGSSNLSPYTVQVTVNDSDELDNDSVTVSFTWTVTLGEPFVVEILPELSRFTGDEDDIINLEEYFNDDKGTENLTYTIEENTNLEIPAVVTGNILTISYPTSPGITNITIRATDSDGLFVEQSFNVTVRERVQSLVLYRVNAGGPAVSAIDENMDWEADSTQENSPYLAISGSNTTSQNIMTGYDQGVDQSTTPLAIYGYDRYDANAGPPNMTYSFPVEKVGRYEVRLYFGNGFEGTSAVGSRIFNVEVEGVVPPQLNNIDLSALFGHQTGGTISHFVDVNDGMLDISFIHVIENPLINGIEILFLSSDENAIQIAQIPNQSNYEGDVLDGTLKVTATGGDGALVYSMTGAPSGVEINSSTGTISGTIGLNTASGSPYQVTVTVNDSDGETTDAVSTQFMWTITKLGDIALWNDKDENENYTGRHECSFVQAGDKFYLMGGRESSQTIDIYDYATNTWSSLINSAPLEFNHFQATEYQGLIWVIGAFKTNNFPSELPAEHIWMFNPASNEWIQGPPIPSNRQRGSAGLTVYNDKFYISGGNTIGHDGGFVAWFDEYDPATGIWTQLADAPRARDHFHSEVIGDKLYLAGGRLSGGTGGTFKPVIPEVDVYDFSTLTWSTLSVNLPTPRAAASVVNYNDKLLVIGGEVENENVYGVVTNDALKITEEYNPISNSWSRIADLNFKRHGTQAIVSGNGVYTLAGSPNKGGGNQKNMEYLGTDTPMGELSVASIISVPLSVQISQGSSKEIPLNIIEGNIGVYITSIELQGPESEKFNILSGKFINALLKANSEQNIVVEYVGLDGTETANLLINYGVSEQKVIALEVVNNGISISPVPDQMNVIGDVLDGSLVVSATGGDGALVYTMTGAPEGVTIDPATGVITGTIAMAADLSSPYTVIITVDDSDEETTDAVTTSFTWTVTSGTPFVTAVLPDLERIVSSVNDVIDLHLHFDDNDGVENLIYTVAQNSNMTIGAVIAGNLLTLSYPTDPAIADITVRATDANNNFVEQTFRVTVNYNPEGTPIEVSQIEAQENTVSDILDGSLAVMATGGDGDLTYSMTGAPAGVIIDSATGVISGTIAMDADVSSPYNVLITVDDSDEDASDAVTTSFTWTILGDDPVIVAVMPNLERYVGAQNENIILENYFDDNDGIDNLSFSAISSNAAVGAVINGKTLILSYPSLSAVSNITVRATDMNSNFVEQTFVVTVKEIPLVLYRVNAGGPVVASIDNEKDWGADTALENSPYLVEPGTNTIAGYTMNNYSQVDLTTTPTAIFSSERSDTSPGVPNLTYSFPVPKPGDYEIRLYFGNGHPGTSRPDRQIFDVSIGNVVHPELNNIDVVALFGNQTGGVINKTVTVTDGVIDISFIHGSKKNPIINGIEIISRLTSETDTPIQVTQIFNQSNYSGDILDGSLVVNATGGDGALVYSISNAPSGVVINSVNGVISGTISQDAHLLSPYNVSVTVDDSDAHNTDAVTTNFSWKVEPKTNEDPYITQVLPNLNRLTGAVDDNIELHNYFDDNGGVENLIYSVTGNTDPAIGTIISANILTLSYPTSPVQSTITIRATDMDGGFVEQSFTITVTEECNESNSSTWYADMDGDGLGDPNTSVVSCEQPEGYVANNDDCDDTDPNIGAATLWYADKDGDGYGDQEDSLASCSQPAGYVADNTDCNDNDNTIYPGAPEIPNDGIDQNCDGEDLVEDAFQGCTAEFWAVSSNWCSSYQPTDSFFKIFGITNQRSVGGKSGTLTLLEALSLKGGGYSKLAKQATAALLNACSPAVVYQYTETQIKTEVQDAFNNSAYNNSYANTLSSKYETANNAGCPSGASSTLASKSTEITEKEAVGSYIEEEIELVEEAIRITLYPNPANAVVYLQTPNPEVKIEAVGMYDYNGKYIRTFIKGNDLIYEGEERYRFDILGMQNGVYILKVSTEISGIFTLRLIKED
jgi:N-acetylneuraminic acid mutarotase